jgi:hypothetical protein
VGTFTYTLVSVKDASSTQCSQVQTGSAVITVNPLPTATIGGTTAVCKDATQPVVTFTGAGGTAPYTFTYKINNGADQTVTTTNGNSVTVAAPTNVVGTFTYTLVSVKDASSTQCSQVQTGSAVITVDAPSVGGSIKEAFTRVCANAASGTLTLENHTGSVVMWQYSTNGGTTWTDVSNTTATLSYPTVQTRLYRALVKNGTCSVVYSDTAVISVDPVTTPVATANPAIICAGESSTLTATNGLPFGGSEFDGTFNQANPAGWRITENGREINFPANANNASTFPWSETNGPKTPFNGGTTYNNLQTDGKFAIASGLGSTTMETPVFSTIGMTTAALEFYQALVFAAGASGKIEISTDGGQNYNRTLIEYTGPRTIGVPASSWAPLSIDLSDFIGLSNLRIRFTYTGADQSNWALDGMKIAGPPIDLDYVWSPATGLSSTTDQTVIATPTQTTTYILGTSLNGCPGGSNPVTVTVNPLPTITSTGTVAPVCFSGTPQTSTLPYSATTHNPTTYRIDWSAAANTAGIPDQGNTTFTSAAGGGNINSIAVPGNLPAGTYSGVMTISNGNNCTTTLPISLTINPLPTATIDGTTTVCQNAAAPSVTFTGATGTAPYTFTYTVSNGTTTTTHTVISSGNIATVPQSTATAGTFTYTLVSVRDASSTTCLRTITGQTVTVTVNPETLITTQPTGTTSYCLNGTPTALSVAASGTGLTYQWYSNGTTNSNAGGTAISGATDASFTPPTAGEGTVYYYVVVTGACGEVPSNPIPVTVAPPLELTELSPLPKQCYGSTVTLRIDVRNRNAQTQFQWYKNDQPITGATDASFVINSISPANDGNYHVVVTGGAPCNTILTSQPISLSSYVQDYTEWTSSQETGVDPIEWHEEKNWTCGIPNLYKDALVPIVSNNKYPYIDNAPDTGGRVRNLIIAANGPNLRIDGILKIAGNVTNNGKIDAYLNGTASTGTIEFVSNLNYYGTSGGYPDNVNNSTPLTLGGSAGIDDTRTQHLKISNLASFTIPVDVYGQLSFVGVNRSLATGDKLTLKSISVPATAMVTDMTNGTGTDQGNRIIGKATVERYIPGSSGRKWRLLTAPVKDITINAAWQENRTWHSGMAVENTNPGFGTLITGGSGFTSAGAANGAGFDYWPLPVGATASIRRYAGSSSLVSNDDATWPGIPSTLTPGAFNSNQAYLLYIRGDRSYSTGTAAGTTVLRPKGEMKEMLSHSIDLVPSSHTLIGNPFASPLNFKKIYDANSTKIQDYFWNWQASVYGYFGVGGYVLIKPTAPGSPVYESIPNTTMTPSPADANIHSGNGFFVTPKTGITFPASITINQAHKTTGIPALNIFRQADKPAKVYANIFADEPGNNLVLMDGVLAQYGTVAQKGENYNIAKAFNGGLNLTIERSARSQIVSDDPIPNPGDTLKLRLWNASARAYQFKLKGTDFDGTGVVPYLVDKHLKKEQEIGTADQIVPYPFTITGEAGSRDPYRFSVVFKLAPLPPATLVAEEKRNGVQLTWKVPEDLTVAQYELEKATDGTNFTAVSKAASKRSADPQEYGHFDGQAGMITHYRVKMTGISGAVGYSNTVTVQLAQASGLTLYPNPVMGSTASLQFTTKPQGRYSLVLFAPNGQRVSQQVVQHNGGTATYQVPVAKLASGSYTLEVEGPSGRKEKIQVVITH